jgi:serine/threonine-protein kinase
MVSPIEPDADANRAAARNLLFALLAFQNNFIDRDALLGGFNAWVADRSRPINELLRERGALDAGRHALIEALVREHLKLHDDDAEKSLADLSSLQPVIAALCRGAAEDVRASLSLVGRDGNDPDATASWLAPAGHRAGHRFRIVRMHAQGGLGLVYEAHDQELGRKVALKEIQPDKADHPELRSRFVLEAEISGGLQHPGIVPIYSLGHYDDGKPYYAMRFVEGASLRDAVARYHEAHPRPDPTTKEFRDLLNRFLDVCHAIAFAHSRGVLHRDLKPQNVMIGEYGEALIIDWGLAKATGRRDPASGGRPEATLVPPSGSGLEPTQAGRAMGTPSYMSPEQAQGDLAALGPATDVYGLGAFLYHMLTGQAPVPAEEGLDAVLSRVIRGEIAPVRALNPRVPVALEAICLKALAPRPDDRYPTARALADDLAHWMADEPVTARRDPLLTRLSRWTRKHRVATAGTAAALVVGLAAALFSYQRERTYSASLDRQRLRAEDRERQAIDAVKRFREAVANEPLLKDTRELDELRKRLLKEPLAFFRALRERLQADRDTRSDSLARLAAASLDLGELTNEIGDKQDALAAFRESLAISQELVTNHPAVAEYQHDLARSHHYLAMLLNATGQPETAQREFRQALAIEQKLAEAHPEITQYQQDLAASRNNLGIVLLTAGQPEAARREYEQALAIRQKLADAHPSVTEYQSDLVASHNNLGSHLHAIGQLEAARRELERGTAIAQKLADTYPTITVYQHGLASSHHNLGVLLIAAGQPEAARREYEQALVIRQKLADIHPSVTEYQTALADIHNNLGALLRRTGQLEEARREYEQSLAIRLKLAAAHPSVTEYQSDLAASHNSVGLLLSDTGQPEAARREYEQALAIRQKLAREHPETPDHASQLGGTLNNMALIDLAAKRFEEARGTLRQAVDWQKKALAANPRHPTYRQFLSNHLGNLIDLARARGRADEAAAVQRELDELNDRDPRFAALDARLAAVLGGDPAKDNAERLVLAQRAYATNRYRSAAKLWAEALDADPELGRDRRAQHRYNGACAAALAAAGHGRDSPPPGEAHKRELRQQARGWLQAELAAWKKVLESTKPKQRGFVVQALRHWQEDSDLAGVRDTDALSELPGAERTAWQSLWDEAAGLIEKAAKAPP